MYTAADAEIQKHKEDHVDELVKDACLRACSEHTRQTMQHSQYHFLWQIPKMLEGIPLIDNQNEETIAYVKQGMESLGFCVRALGRTGVLWIALNEQTMSDFSSQCLRQRD